MAEAFSETKREWRRLKWNLRALICEELMDLGMKIRPDGYTPLIIEGAVEGTFEWMANTVPPSDAGGSHDPK